MLTRVGNRNYHESRNDNEENEEKRESQGRQ